MDWFNCTEIHAEKELSQEVIELIQNTLSDVNLEEAASINGFSVLEVMIKQ